MGICVNQLFNKVAATGSGGSFCRLLGWIEKCVTGKNLFNLY